MMMMMMVMMDDDDDDDGEPDVDNMMAITLMTR